MVSLLGVAGAIPEETVAKHVAEISEHMKNPHYAQLALGDFAGTHPDAGRYLSARSKELGGSEAVVHAVFHAHVIAGCFEKHLGTPVPPLTFAKLDFESGEDAMGRLAGLEPALRDYLVANVDTDVLRDVLAHLALAMRRAASPRRRVPR